MLKQLLVPALLAALTLPATTQQQPPYKATGAAGAPYFKTDDGRTYDPTNSATWGLPYAPNSTLGWPCVAWPVWPPPSLPPLPWWGP